VPVLIGSSEGERAFIGARQAAAVVKSIRDEYDFPIFLNGDHTHSLAKAEEAARAGYDMIGFDGEQAGFGLGPVALGSLGAGRGTSHRLCDRRAVESDGPALSRATTDRRWKRKRSVKSASH
jgi:Fructose-bisphosphate aldolase class-II